MLIGKPILLPAQSLLRTLSPRVSEVILLQADGKPRGTLPAAADVASSLKLSQDQSFFDDIYPETWNGGTMGFSHDFPFRTIDLGVPPFVEPPWPTPGAAMVHGHLSLPEAT